MDSMFRRRAEYRELLLADLSISGRYTICRAFYVRSLEYQDGWYQSNQGWFACSMVCFTNFRNLSSAESSECLDFDWLSSPVRAYTASASLTISEANK